MPEIQIEPEPEPIDGAESAWRAMLAVANTPLSTNDPMVAFALVCIACELRAWRLGEYVGTT